MERLYSHFAALTDNKKKYLGMDAPYEVYLLDDYAEYSTLTDQFLGKGMRMAGIQHHSREKPAFYCFMTSEQPTTSPTCSSTASTTTTGKRGPGWRRGWRTTTSGRSPRGATSSVSPRGSPRRAS
ncbi:MAG: hypothetical protein ACYTGK_02485 [Planctomycetota bacterium]